MAHGSTRQILPLDMTISGLEFPKDGVSAARQTETLDLATSLRQEAFDSPSGLNR
jgi:hypothetical protein